MGGRPLSVFIVIMKILSWNVKGLNSPQKRKKVFLFIEKNKTDVICLQESRIKNKDIRLIKNKKLGKEYISAIDKSKRGVIIYVKNHIESREVFKDLNGHYLGVEITWKGKKCLLVGIYGPQENKNDFYKKIQRKLAKYKYENIIILGNFNGVIQPKLDRSSTKFIKETQGKLPKQFFGLLIHKF